MGGHFPRIQEVVMKLGVIFPQTEFGSDPIAVRDFAQASFRPPGATNLTVGTLGSIAAHQDQP